jgi:hypothetical protein
VTLFAQSAGISDVFIQYGALGCIALLALFAVRVLYNRVDEDRTYHRLRADRLEDELRSLNASIREQYITTIARATEAITDALVALDQARRERP